MKFKKIISMILIGGFLLAVPVTNGNLDWKSWEGNTIFASTAGRDDAQNQLNDLKDDMKDMEDRFQQLESQMSDKAKALSDLMADKAILENDIKHPDIATFIRLLPGTVRKQFCEFSEDELKIALQNQLFGLCNKEISELNNRSQK